MVLDSSTEAPAPTAEPTPTEEPAPTEVPAPTEEPAVTKAPDAAIGGSPADPAPTAVPAPQQGSGFPWLPVVLVAAVVVIAGVLLALFGKKKK